MPLIQNAIRELSLVFMKFDLKPSLPIPKKKKKNTDEKNKHQQIQLKFAFASRP